MKSPNKTILSEIFILSELMKCNRKLPNFNNIFNNFCHSKSGKSMFWGSIYIMFKTSQLLLNFHFILQKNHVNGKTINIYCLPQIQKLRKVNLVNKILSLLSLPVLQLCHWYGIFFNLLTAMVSAMALRHHYPCLDQPNPSATPTCSWPRTPFQTPGAIRPYPSSTAPGLSPAP